MPLVFGKIFETEMDAVMDGMVKPSEENMRDNNEIDPKSHVERELEDLPISWDINDWMEIKPGKIQNVSDINAPRRQRSFELPEIDQDDYSNWLNSTKPGSPLAVDPEKDIDEQMDANPDGLILHEDDKERFKEWIDGDKATDKFYLPWSQDNRLFLRKKKMLTS